MEKGDQVKIWADDWHLIGKIAKVIDPEPVRGSSQILLELDGQKLTLSKQEIELLKP